jgi:hypothetical protein
MSDTNHQANRHSGLATRRQLSRLRILAERTGTTFVAPQTSMDASREIRRLERLPSLPTSDRYRERSTLDADREQLQAANAIQDAEISGYGSSATWR